jgi:hypothetical protein
MAATSPRAEALLLGGFGGEVFVVGVHACASSFRARTQGAFVCEFERGRVRLRTPPRAEQRGPATQRLFRQTLLGRVERQDLDRPEKLNLGLEADAE